MSPPAGEQNQVTLLLQQMKEGEASAIDRLLPLVYGELRKLAAGFMRGENPGHTLQATALANEAFLRMVGAGDATYTNRSHFFGVAAQAMRHILVDHARAKKANKRGGQAVKLQLDEALILSDDQSVQLLELNTALEKLEKLSARQAKIVEMRYFTGLSNEEVGNILGITTRTVIRDWQVAQAWLRRELGG